MPRSAYSRRGFRPKTSPTPPHTSALPPFPPPSPTTRPVDYHYERPHPEAAQSGRDPLVEVDPRNQLATEDTMNSIVTMGRTHKSNFSVATLLGAQPEVFFGSRPRQPDPKSLGNSEGSLARFGSQGPYHPPLGGSSGASSVVAPWMALEIPGSPVELRNPETLAIPLKLKLPSFKGLGKTKNRSGGERRTPISQPPLSVRSPLVHARPSLSNDKLALSAIQFKNTDPDNTCLIPTRDPNSEEGSDPSCDSCSSLPLESMPPTPCTIRSGFVRPGSPGSTQLRLNGGDSKYNTPLYSGNLPSFHDIELLKSRRRSFPTISQDDMSLHSQTVGEKHKSINRMSRRASLSATSMLSSTSAPLQTPSLTSQSDGGHDYIQHSPQSVSTPTDSGFATGGQGISPVTPLSPIIFQSIPSSQLDPTRLPVAELVVSPSPGPPSKDYDDSTPTPVASHPEMPFSALVANPTSLNSSRSSSRSRSASRSRLSGSKTSRSPTPETPSPTPARTKVLPIQTRKWEEEEQALTSKIVEGHPEGACVIRFEPKHGWMGFWNRSNVDSVIDELRELRVPKFSV